MSENNILVSVMVPVYNVEKYIEKCIKSIITQTYNELQIILIDDGSNDKSGHICDKYASIDKRIVVEHKTHGGTVSTRKRGISIAKGMYTVCVDGDDWIDKDTIESYVNIWKKYNADIIMVTAHYNDYESQQEMIGKSLSEGYVEAENYNERVFPYLLGDNEEFGRVLSYSLCYNAFRTNLLKECQQKVNDNIYCGEDGACFLRCLSKSKSVYITNVCKYHYVQRSDSTSHRIRPNAEQEIEALYIDLIGAFQGSPFEDELKKRAIRLIHENILFSNLNIYWKYHSDVLFPFVDVKANKNIILYGAGSIGQQMYQALPQDKYKLVGWVDQKWEYYREKGFPVNDVNSIKNVMYDYIIVTLINKRVANQIKKNLIELGVDANKIQTINTEVFNEKNIPFKLTE